METVGYILRLTFIYVLYPVLILVIFLYILSSIGTIVSTASSSGSGMRRLIGALLPVIVLIFITITDTEEESGRVTTQTVCLVNNLCQFLIGLGISNVFVFLGFRRFFANSENDIWTALCAMLLSAMGGFILYSIMQDILSSMHYMLFGIVLGCGFHIMFRRLPFADDDVKEIKLDWTHKDSETLFKFQKVQLIRDTLKFDLIAHNMHKSYYQCLFVTATEDSVHMDDEFGGEYKGATVTFRRGLDNKLALNQKKIFTIAIPAPEKEVSLVNLHFGIFSKYIGDDQSCEEPLVNLGYNFHQLEWDVSWIR